MALRRGWSTENLVGMATSGFTRIRKMLHPAGEGDDGDAVDLAGHCRRVDERSKQGVHATPESFVGCFDAFVNEVRQIIEAPQPGELSSVPMPRTDSPPDDAGRTRLKRSQEHSILQFFDVLQRVPAASIEQFAARPLIESGALECLLYVHTNTAGKFTRKMIDSATHCLLHLLSTQPALLCHVTEPVVDSVKTNSAPADLAAGLVPLVRTLNLIVEVLRRADICAPDLANEAKAHFAQLGLIATLRSLVQRCKAACEGELSSRLQAPLCTLGIVSLSAIGGVFRSNVPIRSALLQDSCEQLVVEWAFFVSRIDTMQSAVSATVVSPVTGKTEEHTVTCDAAAVWGSEMTGFLVELATSNSFSLQRQLGLNDDSPYAAPVVAPSSATHAQSGLGPGLGAPRWEHIPADWDSMLGSAVVLPWRVASALASCELTPASATLLLRGLAGVDYSDTSAEFVLKATIASLLCLCRANPRNVFMLHEAGAVATLIGFMAPDSGVFHLPDAAVLPAPPAEGAGDVWPVCSALLTTMLGLVMGPKELELLMGTIQSMVHQNPSRDDCDTVETCLATLASSTYVKGLFWLDGSSNRRAAASIDRICGRWYGYSFAAWLSPACVWPEGSQLFCIRDPNLTSAMSVCLVANGRTKCLAIKSATSKDQFTLVQLPEAVIGDKWHHVAVVHNISGLTVYVDGRKCGSASVSYPKEPAKPQRLRIAFGTADREFQVPGFFGALAGAEMIDGVLSDTTLEKIVAAGVGSTASSIENLAAEKILAQLTVTAAGEGCLRGSLIKDDSLTAEGPCVAFHTFPDVAASLATADVLGWSKRVIAALGVSANRSSVAILTMELLAGALHQRGEAALAEWTAQDMTAFLGGELCSWDTTQPEVISALFALVMAGGTKRFRDHPTTAAILRLLLDLILTTGVESRGATLREVSEYLDEPANAAFFNQHIGVGSLLHLGMHIENANVTEFAHAAEKVVRQPPELEATLRFIVAPCKANPSSASVDSSDRQLAYRRVRASATLVKCELLRMLYEVAKARPAMLEMLTQVGGLQHCMSLLQGETHDSELLRVIAIRIVALILHASKKQRELFVRSNSFDVLGSALLAHARTTPVGLPTFNALFKFALDSYRPTMSDDAAVLRKLREPSRPAHADPTALALHGHTPSMAQVRPLICRAHSITSIGSSDVSDVDARLSMDDNGDGSRDALQYPNVVHIILRLLTPIAAAASGTSAPDIAAGDAVGLGSDVPSTMDPTSAGDILHRVLRYLQRMVELSHNAAALSPQPWLAWVWGAVEPLMTASSSSPSGAGPKVEACIRAIVRIVTVADMSRGRTKGGLALKRARDMVEAPALQRIVLEETVRYFVSAKRLDTMDADDAASVLRNLAEGAYAGVEDALVPLPLSLGLEMVRGVESIAVTNTIWIRQKMKAFRAFELRDRLALFLLHSCPDITSQSSEVRDVLLAVTQQDQNAALVVLKQMCDAARDRDDTKFEVLQDMLRRYYVADDDQRRMVSRAVGDADAVDRLVNERKVVDGAEVRAESFVAWIAKNEGAWDVIAQRIAKAAKSLESDFAARAEKREKENINRQRSRKLEVDKRRSTESKIWADAERTFAEAVFKATSVHETTVDSVERDRIARFERYRALSSARESRNGTPRFTGNRVES